MARARLHIICGNCGCNNEFKFEIDHQGRDVSDEETKFEPEVYISCGNCSTSHSLSDNAEMRERQRG